MYMNDDDELVLAGLEEKVLDVAEKYIYCRLASPVCAVHVPDTILMNLNVTRQALAIQSWAKEQQVELGGTSVCNKC